MSRLLGLLDIPAIPQELLPTVAEIIEQPRIDRAHKKLNNTLFMPKQIYDEPLLNWLEENVLTRLFGTKRSPDHKHFRFQVMYPGFPTHIDRYRRRVALNYLLELGGDDVVTQEYSNDETVLRDEMKFGLYQWHWLITEIPHNAIRITTPRVSLTVSLLPHEEEMFFSTVNYTPLSVPLLKE